MLMSLPPLLPYRLYISPFPFLLLLCTASALLLPSPTWAQTKQRSLGSADSTLSSTLADSASAARQYLGMARQALRANDLDGAQVLLDKAVAAWPVQPAYAVSALSVALLRQDIPTIEKYLSSLALHEAGAELLSDTVLSQTASGSDALRHSYQRWQHSLKPVLRSSLFAQLSDSTLFPESIDHDVSTGATYVSSIRHRTILELDNKGNERYVVSPSAPLAASVMGVKVDTDRRHLWATIATLPFSQSWGENSSSPAAALIRLRIADGVVVGTWKIDSAHLHTPGDIALSKNGDVIVSDSKAPVLHILKRGATHLQSLSNVHFRSLQGIAINNDSAVAYIADYSHGILMIDLANYNVTPLAHAKGVTTTGIDGLALYGNDLVAVQNGARHAKVVKFSLSAKGDSITSATTIDRRFTDADEPTAGVIIGDSFVYIGNSQWEKYDQSGSRRKDTKLTKPNLFRIQLKASTDPQQHEKEL